MDGSRQLLAESVTMFLRRREKEMPAMPLEGALGPNSRLDDADALAIAKPDAVCVNGDGHLLASSGLEVLLIRRWGETPERWAGFDAPVSALAVSEGGQVAVGLAGGRVVVRGPSGEVSPGWTPSSLPRAVADCLFLSEDEIAVVDHGYGPQDPILSLAPWDTATRGQVIAISRTGETRVVAAGLHCPMGIARGANGSLVLSELETARVIVSSGKVLQSGYPAYLGRLRKAGAGYAIACLSRRDPLIEFLKTEREFVTRMKANIDPRHWISPRASPEFSYEFPIELGATRLFGEIKPWAPSFSYGLVIETDADMTPVGSAHSRANGFRHAISDVAAWNGGLIAVSRASEEILKFSPTGNADER
jgi:hypothetical protein